ncbi:uncharacterized protein BJ212DRAFT_1303616 [Suillus subaureus]|uniref:Uncharacterized protein n=1 Tax=Suillus subaureus TaxID=48587 RepID=A0A9P7J7W1_9AGAM|nr:uncharacterized protein BJ212DRAFT_1303616 [Suillus subaureus]KAG1807165.1 hypothetical protein BJ212DRAFT_1303616 [Suillus subaureus]
MGVTDPATVWKALEDKYQASVSICFMSLMGHVFDLPKAANSDSLTKTIKEIMDIKAQFKVIESMEWKCNKYMLIQALLHALPDFYALLSQLILHSGDANAGKLMLEGVISQIRNLEQHYFSPPTTMAARVAKAGKPTKCAKLKDFDASKGDKWELSWHLMCGSLQLDIIPSFLCLPTHEANFSNILLQLHIWNQTTLSLLATLPIIHH